MLWARTRDQALEMLGSEGISLTERLRERAHGGGASTKTNKLTAPERQCYAWERTLRIEQAVRALDNGRRDLVTYRYVNDGSLKKFAEAAGVSGAAVSKALAKAVETVGRDVAFGDAAVAARKALAGARERTRTRA